MVKVRVPATSANLGSGFDALGIALSLYNEVYMEECDGCFIESMDGVAVPTDESNMIYSSAKRMFDICGRPFYGLKIRQINNIPLTRGLGSSSACLVAGIGGANRLLGDPLSTHELVNLAAAMEGHPDNTTPALVGGLVTCAVSEGRVYYVSVPVSDKFRFAAMIPPEPLSTELSRSVLPNSVTRERAVFNLSRTALMTASLFSGDIENIKIATDDVLHQPYRLGLIKGGDAAFRIARELGAFGVYISGAGSTIMAIIDKQNNSFKDKAILNLNKNGAFDWDVQILDCDEQGAEITLTQEGM